MLILADRHHAFASLPSPLTPKIAPCFIAARSAASLKRAVGV